VKQENLFAPVPVERFNILTKEELIVLAREHQRIIDIYAKDNDRLRAQAEELRQKSLFIADQFITIKNKLFGKSSERSGRKSSNTTKVKNKDKRILLPSERYPEALLIEKHITLDNPPPCSCCGVQLQDSGMTEESEYLTKIPAQFYVVVQVRHKYACRSCHGEMKTAPCLPRITPGGSYSDELIIDTAVSKYCDLMPIERQVKVAERSGIKGLPPQSLIEGTHQLADFLRVIYLKLKSEILASTWLHADETPHRMLEGDAKSGWYLWGFSAKNTSYFECHDTRSGDVASDLLIESNCEYLVSDVYSGYSKAIGIVNKDRAENNKPVIKSIYCNAHARRYFKQAGDSFPDESKYYISQYRKIYRLEGLATKYPDRKEQIRLRIRKYFERIKNKCLQEIAGYSNKSSLVKAMNYFLKNYDGFTRFIEHMDLPIDNNPAERLLRSPVIGRKTWLGTHSKRGAETSAILFSIIESCKLNKVDPLKYLKNLVEDLHYGKNPYTPSEYKYLAKN
jgi:transposase